VNDIKLFVGRNLKAIRKERQLSLEDLSDITGVSASMLGEIERGVTNPTITILWKISNGLKVPLTALIKENSGSVSVAYLQNSNVSIQGDGYKFFSLFNFDQEKKTEIFYKIFDPCSVLESTGHSKGMEEYIFVVEGILTIKVNGEIFKLAKGDAITFNASVDHSYENNGNQIASAFILIYYGN